MSAAGTRQPSSNEEFLRQAYTGIRSQMGLSFRRWDFLPSYATEAGPFGPELRCPVGWNIPAEMLYTPSERFTLATCCVEIGVLLKSGNPILDGLAKWLSRVDKDLMVQVQRINDAPIKRYSRQMLRGHMKVPAFRRAVLQSQVEVLEDIKSFAKSVGVEFEEPATPVLTVG